MQNYILSKKPVPSRIHYLHTYVTTFISNLVSEEKIHRICSFKLLRILQKD
ncbi:hypothetical protein I79_016032 [Cricetulus griseus]|uniref:Uncharacterized protein n=1 Tax=Cricetulus griseus TaxID=10029 RepID=G3HYA8_CRIGR|nr:hypothetical protein I79_016032 [Cricetulus griseus]